MEIMRDRQAKTLFLYWKDYTESCKEILPGKL